MSVTWVFVFVRDLTKSCFVCVSRAAGEPYFHDRVWKSDTNNEWSWGVAYNMNIASWVGLLLTDCFLFVLWSTAAGDDEGEADEEEEEVEEDSKAAVAASGAGSP